MNSRDKTLIARWIDRRDPDAFAELVSRHSGMVYGTCARILGNTTEAEDVTQECFVILAAKGATIRSSLEGWLHKLATHRSLDRVRAEKRRQKRESSFAENVTGPPEPRWDDIKIYVDEAIAALPEKLRYPIVSHFLEGQTYEAIAEKLDVPRSTVSSRVQKGIELVRKSLKKRGIAVAISALITVMGTRLTEAVQLPASIPVALGRLAIAGTGGTVCAGTAAGGVGLVSRLLVRGGMAMVTKKVVITLGVLAVALGASYLLVAPNRRTVSDRETVSTATSGEGKLSQLRGEAEEKEAGTPRKEAADPAQSSSQEARATGARRVEPGSGSFTAFLEKFMDALGQTPEQEEDELEPVRPADVPPVNGAHYFLLAAELFPEVDRDWLKAKLAEIRSTGVMEDPDLLAFLAACQDSFDAIRQGLAVGNAELPPSRYGPAEPLPYLPAYRNLAYAMCVEAEMLAARGDYRAAFAMYDTLVSFGNESGRGGFILHGIVGYAIQGIAIESLSYVMASGWAAPDEYRFLIEQLYAADMRQYRVWEMAESEAQDWTLWLDRMTQEGDTVFAEVFEAMCGDIEGLKDALPGMTPAEMVSLFREMLADLDRIAAYLELPYYEAQLIDADSLLGDNPISQADRVPRFNGAEARMAASVRGVMVMAAVELYRAEHDTYPATLTQLVPDYLQVLPEDPFTGASFGYAAGSNDYLLYSLGPDMEDDGGILLDPTVPFETWQGDWVIHGENVSIR